MAGSVSSGRRCGTRSSRSRKSRCPSSRTRCGPCGSDFSQRRAPSYLALEKAKEAPTRLTFRFGTCEAATVPVAPAVRAFFGPRERIFCRAGMVCPDPGSCGPGRTGPTFARRSGCAESDVDGFGKSFDTLHLRLIFDGITSLPRGENDFCLKMSHPRLAGCPAGCQSYIRPSLATGGSRARDRRRSDARRSGRRGGGPGGGPGVARPPADPAAAVEIGLKHERSRRWLDAIDSYEHALKHFPDNAEIKYGLRRSQIQFAIERRYEDGSFESRLLQLPRESAFALFDKVVENVRMYYVEEVSATSFVAHGTESLYHALANEKFLAHNLRQVDHARVAHMRQVLRERFWNRPIEDFSAARDTVSEVANLVERELNLPATTVVFEYVFGGCNCLDDYSNFLTPDRLTDLHGNINGEFVGLVIEMKGEPGKGMFLVNVLPDSPAEQGGLHAGEYIVAINGSSCKNMTTDEAAKVLRGPPGTRVALAIEGAPGSAPRQGEFIRRAVEVKSIPVARIVDREHGIAYIRMTAFQATSPRELDAALSQLSHEGMRALIWDLRGNPGGLLSAATGVLDRFIDTGVLVSTRGRSLDQNSSFSASPHQKYNVPLVLLVDENSASASEIVAGAVHDQKRGTLAARTA